MFRVIEPKDHRYYRARIDLLKGMMELYFKLPLCDQEQAQTVYFVAEKEEGDVYGGAILYKKYLFPSFIPPQGEMWEAIPFLLVEHPSFKDKAIPIRDFYNDLFKKIIQYGAQRRITFLWCALSSRDYGWIKRLSVWEHELVINSQISKDGFFHGMFLRKPYQCFNRKPQSFNSFSCMKRVSL